MGAEETTTGGTESGVRLLKLGGLVYLLYCFESYNES